MIDADTRAVFFDAVGTLLFPRQPVGQTYAEAGRRHGSRLTEADIRGPFRTAFVRQEQLDEAAGWRTDEARERARWRAVVAGAIPDADPDRPFAELWAHFARPEAWTVNPEAADLFAELTRRGIAVGVGSNFDARLLGLVEAIPALRPLRDRCVISSRVGWRKPAAEFFRVLTQTAGCEPGRILYVGDDFRNDFAGATAAGIRAVLYDPDARTTGSPGIGRLRDILPR